jgi:hypothetical protein
LDFAKLFASVDITLLRVIELPHTTQGKQLPFVLLLVNGMLEYKGIIPSFPNGLINRFGKSVTGIDACTIVGILKVSKDYFFCID